MTQENKDYAEELGKAVRQGEAQILPLIKGAILAADIFESDDHIRRLGLARDIADLLAINVRTRILKEIDRADLKVNHTLQELVG